MPQPPQHPLRRFGRIAGLGVRLAGSVVHSRIDRQQPKDWAPVGALLGDALGEMKGPVLKLGQMAGQWQGVLPEPITTALAKLQNQVPPMDWPQVQTALSQSYGQPPETMFAWIDPTPFAAASLGQVHRATTHEGRAVVIKVQYPGIRAICRSDLQQIRRILPLGRLAGAPQAQLTGIFTELERVIQEELDYEQEREHIQAFRTHFADWPEVHIPEPIESLTRHNVLVLEEVPAMSLDQAADLPVAQRWRLTQTLIEFFVAQAFSLGWLHADPHAGNFGVTAEGRLAVFDFGCVQPVSAAQRNAYWQLFNAVADDDIHLVERGFQQLGTRKPQTDAPTPVYQQLLAILHPLIKPGAYWDFATAETHQQILAMLPQSLDLLGSMQPSANTLMINRTLEGHYWNCRTLGLAVPLERWLRAARSRALAG